MQKNPTLPQPRYNTTITSQKACEIIGILEILKGHGVGTEAGLLQEFAVANKQPYNLLLSQKNENNRPKSLSELKIKV